MPSLLSGESADYMTMPLCKWIKLLFASSQPVLLPRAKKSVVSVKGLKARQVRIELADITVEGISIISECAQLQLAVQLIPLFSRTTY